MDQAGFTVIVRSTNQKFKDVNIQLDSECTIQDLKRKIQSDYPGYPEANTQKLIFNGRMLVDHDRINTVIKESKSVVHLLYSAKESKEDNIQENVTPASIPQASEIRHRFPSQVPIANPISQPYGVHDYGTTYSQAYSEWLQQYQQHYSNYMQYFAAQNPYLTLPTGMQSVAAVEAANVANQPPGGAHEPEQQNAEAGLVVAEEIGQDWLDVVFALTRFMFLLSIIYFYSTTYRFIIAVTLLLGIYLYQAGIFQVHRRPVLPQEADNPRPQPPTDDNNNNDGESGDEQQEQLNVQPPPSLFATTICFIKSFFLSLVPTGPPAVVN